MIEIIEISVLILTIFYCVRAMLYITSWKLLPITESLNKEKPLISVLIPARNEEKSIGKCLDSLLKQTYPNLEIIVVDDQSTDRTLEIVQKFTKKNSRIKLIQGKPLPQGWLGKSWALYQGVQLAKGEWFLFSDADVILEPLTVNSVYQYVVKNGVDFLTLKFTLLVKTFWAKVLLPSINFIKAWFVPSPKRVNDINTPAIQAKGGFIFVKKSIYGNLGGHQAVKDDFIESAALMRNFKKTKRKVALLDGSHMIKIQQSDNLKEIVNSYSKFFYKLFQSKINGFLVFLYIFIILGVISPIGILIFLFVFKFGELNLNSILWLAIQISILFSAAVVFYRKDNFSSRYALALPLGAIILIGTIFKALYELAIKRKRSWRGRVYQ